MKDSIQDWARLMLGSPSLSELRFLQTNWRDPRIARWSFNYLRQLLPTAPIAAAATPRLLPEARMALDDLAFRRPNGTTQTLSEFLTSSQTDCFAVMKDGALVYERFGGFGLSDRQHILFSITKSMASLLAGVLVGQGLLDPKRVVTDYLPELAQSAYQGATVRNLLDMQVASCFIEDYLDTEGIFMAYRRAAAWNPVEEGVKTDGLRAFLSRMPASDGAHGQRHHYCSPHSDVLGWLIERVGEASFADLFATFIMQPCGAMHEAYISLDTFGVPRVSGGLCVSVHDLLRIGQMLCDAGSVDGKAVVPESWVADISRKRDNDIWLKQNEGKGPRLFFNGNYRAKWYQVDQEKQVICAIGIHGQWLWIDLEKRLVVVKLASSSSVIDTEDDLNFLEACETVRNVFD